MASTPLPAQRPWHDTAPNYNKDVALSSGACTPRLIELASSLASLTSPTASALEFGAGTGSLTLPLASTYPGLPILATDISDAMLAQLQAAAIHLHPNISLLNVDMTRHATYGKLQHRRFSHIFSTMAIQSAPSPNLALEQWKQLLKPDGVVSIAIWAVDDGFSVHDIWNRAATRADASYVPPVWVPPERWPTLTHLENGVREAGFVDVVAEQVPIGFGYGLEALMRFFWESRNPMCLMMQDSYGDRDLGKVKEEMVQVLREDYGDGWEVPLDAGLVVARLPKMNGETAEETR